MQVDCKAPAFIVSPGRACRALNAQADLQNFVAVGENEASRAGFPTDLGCEKTSRSI
jgi:hypothetical protein